MTGQVPARMAVWRIFLRIAFREGSPNHLKASARESFRPRSGFEVRSGSAMLGRCLFFERESPPAWWILFL